MSTVTIHPNGDGTIGNWTDESSGTTDLWATVDDLVASPNDADFAMCGSAPSTLFLLLDDMPGDFDTMGGTIVVKMRCRHTSGSGSRVLIGAVGIVESDETTTLTDTDTPNTTTSLDDYTLTLNVTGATSKAAWDGARLKIPMNSGFVGAVEITAIQVDVTYTATGGDSPGSGTNQNASILLAM